MNAPVTPQQMDKYADVSTPDYCSFSVEAETSASLDQLEFSSVHKPWSLDMRTSRGSSLIDDEGDDELPLNQMDAQIERAFSREKAPVGLAPLSSDSESSSQNDSLEIDSDDENEARHLSVPTAATSNQITCNLTPRLSKTTTRNDQTPPNPLNALKVLNPGVPQGHATHRGHRRQHLMNRAVGTPQRPDSNALASTESNVATTFAADCMCIAIEDMTQFFCPGTPRSTTIDNTTQLPAGVDCFPAYDYVMASSPTRKSSFTSFWTSPNSSPLPRSREMLHLLDANLPRNRSYAQKRKHVRKLLAVWHGAEGLVETNSAGSRDDYCLVDKLERQRKTKSVAEPKLCYDSDPEEEVLGRSRRRTALLSGRKEARFRQFCPEPFTHLDTDEESSSDDDTSSYETAKCSSPISEPPAPRNADSKMSFDFVQSVDTDGATQGSDDSIKNEASHSIANATSTSASLSTTGHSRFHTIRRSPGETQEGSDSVYSSHSGSTAMNYCEKKHQQFPLPQYFHSYPTHWTEFQLLFSGNVDEDSIKSQVHELSNVRFPLVWHPRDVSRENSKAKTEGGDTKQVNRIHSSTSSKITSLSSNANEESSSNSAKGTTFPISVQGAFEVGAHLEQMVVQPKFTWTPTVQPNRLSEDPEANHRELFLSGSSPPQVELLSIIRVNTAMELDRNLYPYARLERTCIVTTNDKKHPTIVLEARSIQERDWLVFSLRLIVARLASIIITRDEDMLHEFFSPYSALMRLEEEDERPRPESHHQGQDNSSFECVETPGAPCSNAMVEINEEGPDDFVFSTTPCNEEGIADDESDAYPVNDMIDHDMVSEDGEIDLEADDEDGGYQVRDDHDIEDSIRARNSGAYAILKRSLTASGPLVKYENNNDQFHEEPMCRTRSY